MLFICPVCKQEIVSENSNISKHNNNYDEVCYGSYMFAGHCQEARTFSRRIKNFFWAIKNFFRTIIIKMYK